ncbi:uncharacterized protein LOC126672694 [Mercurialis annua]|uniref:uncharacterized protein LOC126672694 n=1 Tax=Mercurialis annua TaxID=3986 RepID=UPI00215EECD9|nr:uncharacterized protein LOC126672694 [Mercurialis annua]XP_050222607.1 uncharacterized protein LOC126672694 [Mercurialis annua]XP_050222608.1 uncharacterized protein LOC126672694 [Mercurialis annua]
MKVLQGSSQSREPKFSTQSSHQLPSEQQNELPEMLGSSNNSRKVTREDIEVVQNLIERCLQLYMNRNEVANILLHQARIEPGFTKLVWQKLEEENAEFFKEYHTRLMLKKQINVFNQLLEHQYRVMESPSCPNVPLAPVKNEIEHMSVDNPHMGYSVQHQPPIPSTCHPQFDLVNGIPVSSYCHPMQINYGREAVINGDPAELVHATSAVKSEMTWSPASVASNCAYASHVTTPEAWPLGSGCNTYSPKESHQPLGHIPWTLSFLDIAAKEHGNCSGSEISLDSLEQNDNIDEFFADDIPAGDAETEERSESGA